MTLQSIWIAILTALEFHLQVRVMNATSFSVIMDFIAFTDSDDEVLPIGVRTIAAKHQ